ncbi:uncharacterized protein LOC127723618 [Mytilus californianus]|uniref:uncharacterized protein LOC127723618 n=1 Tax=Mytilus californianus TaxID=6549 RepID=UPI0022467B70|nr:uncharacterized protein LOC127723618 [Mytilus californianus]
MPVDKESAFFNLKTLEGETITSEALSTEELSNIITTAKKERKKLFVSFDWTEVHSKPKALTTVIIAWATKQNSKLFERNVLTIEENDIKSTLPKIKEILEDSITTKVTFNPRADFTSLLHYGIKLQNIFDIQACVQCINARKNKKGALVMNESNTLDEICTMYNIRNDDNLPMHVSNVICQMDIEEYLTKKNGKWFTALKRIKFLYRRRMVRIIHLTNKQEERMRRNSHRFSSHEENTTTAARKDDKRRKRTTCLYQCSIGIEIENDSSKGYCMGLKEKVTNNRQNMSGISENDYVKHNSMNECSASSVSERHTSDEIQKVCVLAKYQNTLQRCNKRTSNR